MRATCGTNRHGPATGADRVGVRWVSNPPWAALATTPSALGPAKPDLWDNALAATINGLYKAYLIHRRGCRRPWRSFEADELATLEWVDWFNNRRPLEPIGNPVGRG